MPSDAGVLSGALWSFVLVLARVSSVVALVPIPGWKRGPDASRVILSLALTGGLFPVWPSPLKQNPGIGNLAVGIAAEAFFGLVLGLVVGLSIEAFLLAAQVLGMQAGYSYASTIDPSSEADSTVLQVLSQLMAGLLFFSLRMDAELVKALAGSLLRHPPGIWTGSWAHAHMIVQLGSEMWKTGLRLALPIVALLLMLDICLALVGRVQAQLQLLSLTFPVKMLVTLMAMAALIAAFSYNFRQQAEWIVAAWAR